MDIFGTVSDVWQKYTPAGIIYKNVKGPVSDISKTISDGVGAVKKYWYVPVIVAGVVVGWRVVSTVKTGALLKSIIKK